MRIPVVWLFVANALFVIILVISGNLWWLSQWQRVDEEIHQITTKAIDSQTAFKEIINEKWPLQRELTESTSLVYRLAHELELLLLDSSRDYVALRRLALEIENRSMRIQPDKDEDHGLRELKRQFNNNFNILLDIIYEVLETSSPNQLALLVEDSKQILMQIQTVSSELVGDIEQDLANAQLHSVSNSESMIKQASLASDFIHSSHQKILLFVIVTSLLILLSQLIFTRVLKERLSGISRVIQSIIEGGRLNQVVPFSQSNDMIGYIGYLFNQMLEKLKTSQNQLTLQKEKAESSARAKSEFLANMSHEIRTPVHAITGLIHLMRAERPPPKIESQLIKSESAVEALLHVIDNVLDFSKIAENKLELESQPFSLWASMESLIDLFNGQFNQKKLDLTLMIEPDVPNWVVGDRLRINQILINLINNAYKFTDEGGVALVVKRRSVDGCGIAFSVSDSGIGIESNALKCLFDEFSQVDVSTTRKYGGTGLGLAISLKLSQLMNGGIKVESEVGLGSTFTVDVELLSSENGKPFFPPALTSTKTLLWISESPNTKKMLAFWLMEWGISEVEVGALEDLPSQLSCGADALLVDLPTEAHVARFQTLLRNDNTGFLATRPMILVSHSAMDSLTSSYITLIDRPVRPSELFNAIVDSLALPFTKVERLNNETEQGLTVQAIQASLVGARVLIVDDVEINQHIAAEILSRAGVVTAVADNGQTALDMLAEQSFDLVLMDLQMPVMGGIEATRHIREQMKLESLPVIAMSANVIKGVVEECEQVGFNGYLSKPIDVTALWEMLGQWIAPRESVGVLDEVVSTDDSGELPEQLLGIEIEDALARLGGNRALYLSLLQDFKRQYGQSDEDFAQFLQRNAYDLIGNAAHKLKGTSANLGMMDLSNAAKLTEELAKLSVEDATREISDLNAALSQLSFQLTRVLTGLESLQSPSSAPILAVSEMSSTSTLSEEEVARVVSRLQTLSELIDASDSDSLDTIGQLRGELSGKGICSYLSVIEESLSCFDFEEASLALSRLFHHLGKMESERCVQPAK